MTNYVIIAPPSSSLSNEAVQRLFRSDRSIQIVPGVAWAVASELYTCAEVRDKIRSGSDETTCVVVKATEYNGYAKRELWEKLESWER